MTPTDDIIVDSQKPQGVFNLRELWRYRDLLFVLAKRDVSVRYRQTSLGVVWAVLQPLITMLIFSLIFGRLAGIKSGDVPYSLFAFSGLLPWIFFSSAVTAAGSSVLNSSNLVTKVYFPRIIIPIAAVGAPLVDLLIATAFMFLLMLYKGYWPATSVIWLPCLFMLMAITALGVGALLAALIVAYRDFRHLLAPLITSWMFLTPVIYPPTMVPEAWRWLLLFNPMAGIVGGIRSAWFGTPMDFQALGAAAVISLLMLWAGVAYFRSVQQRFADIV
jgi:lipopolysaccharide transport system permease protein